MSRTVDSIAVALLAASGLAGVVFWPALPAEMAIHFDASGTPDNFVPKLVGIAFIPLVGLLTIAVVRYAPRLDTKPTDRRILDVSVLFVSGVIAYVQTLVLAWNLGYRVDITLALVPVFLGTALLVGYAFYRERLSGG